MKTLKGLKKSQSNGNSAESSTIFNLLSKGGRTFLSALKKKSIRANNSWYRILPIDKRRLIEAVIQTVDKIRSNQLLEILTPIAGRLLKAVGGIQGLMGSLSYGMQNFGRPQAERISLIAKKWGVSQAEKWAVDEGFIRFLTIVDMNDIPIYRVSSKL